jgi:hypothetical protein
LRSLSDFNVQVVGKWQMETPKRKVEENIETVARK